MLKKLSIVVGLIAALIVADTLTIQYQKERARLDFLCTYRLTGHCDCQTSNEACLQKCAVAKGIAKSQCMEELKPSYYKLQDKYTWRYLVLLPLAFGAGVGAVRGASSLRRK